MQVMFNADDFGWDDEANKGILALCEAGKLQGVSIMANYATEYWLNRIAAYQSTIRIGLHVVLNEGLSVARPSEIFTLLDLNNEGNFYPSHVLWQRYLMGKIDNKHILAEIKAQVQKLRDNGIFALHADTHQHIHHFPLLGKVILHGLKDAGITSVRNSLPYEQNDMRRRILAAFCFFTRRSLSSFSHNELLITYLASKNSFSKEALAALLKELYLQKVQKVELMCHPALSDRKGSYLKRKKEFDFLMQWE